MSPPKDPPSRIRIEDDREPTNRDIMGAVERIDTRLVRVENYLNGGSDYEKGILQSVARLKQESEARKAWTVMAMGAAVSGLGTAVWLILKQAVKGEA